MIIRRNNEPVVHGHLLEYTTPWKRYEIFPEKFFAGFIIDDIGEKIRISKSCLKIFFKAYRK